MHGTSEVIVKNNVFFGAFGSGIFVEDGTELFNEFDHNLCVYNVTATSDEAGFKIESIPISTGSDKRRLPYMCENNKLFKYKNRIVIDVATGTFNTPNAFKLGDEICAAISIIPTYT